MIDIPRIEILILESDIILANRWIKGIKDLYRGEINCTHTADAHTAVELLRDRDISAVVMRIVPENSTTIDDLRRIHTGVNQHSPNTEVIVLAGADEQQLIRELGQLGSRFAQKTNTAVSSQDLMQLIKKLVAKKTGSFEPIDHREISAMNSRLLRGEFELKGISEKIEGNSERIEELCRVIYGGPGLTGMDSKIDGLSRDIGRAIVKLDSLENSVVNDVLEQLWGRVARQLWTWVSENKLAVILPTLTAIGLAVAKLLSR